jgi:hypothetical protein
MVAEVVVQVQTVVDLLDLLEVQVLHQDQVVLLVVAFYLMRQTQELAVMLEAVVVVLEVLEELGY